MVEVKESRTCLLNGGCNVQGNFIIYLLKKSRCNPLRSSCVRGEEVCKGHIHFFPEGGYRLWCCLL